MSAVFVSQSAAQLQNRA